MDAGRQLGSYRLIAKIGAGGMGEVWKAEDLSLRRTVAIKILPAASATDRESNERFRREARTAAQLIHPNIATIFAIDQSDDRSFIVMEYVEGEPLSRLIRSSRLGPQEVVGIARRVADALGEAHGKGIVHRDVKPDNVIVAGTRVKVLDFGIAKRYGHDAGPPDAPASDTEFRTEAGIIVGTVQYMSPEQAMGKKLDGRSDIFSLGVVMYEALAGRLPFDGDSPALTLTKIIRDEPEHVRVTRPDIAPALAAIVMRCLEKDPARRFRDARELAAALDGTVRGAPSDVARAQDLDNETPTVSTTPKPVPPTVRRLPRTVVERPVVARRPSALPWVVAMVAVVVASVAGTALYFTRRGGSEGAKPAEVVPVQLSAPAGTEIAVTPPAPATDGAAEPDTGVVASVPAPSVTQPPAAVEPTREEARAAPLLGRIDQGELSGVPPPGATIPEQADFFYRKGLAQLDRRQPLDAAVSFRKVVELDPRRADAWVRSGELALFLRSPDTALADLRRAAELGGGLDDRDLLTARFGSAVAQGDVGAMNEACGDAPFDRVHNELRRLAVKRGATDCPLPIGVGIEGGRRAPPAGQGGSLPAPRPVRKP